MPIFRYLLLSVFLSAGIGLPALEAEEWVLVEKGKATVPISTSPGSGEEEMNLAEELATQLQRISGAEFAIKKGTTGKAIHLRISSGDEPAASEREDYSLRSGPDGLVIAGRTTLALQHAVWDFLYRLGYRQYFPGRTWEVVPSLDRIAVDLDVNESPDYDSRRIWYGYGFRDHNREAWEDWVKKNRMEGGFHLNTGHAYGRMIRSQRKSFEAHPEYYALLDGERKVYDHAKLCISNPGVQKAAVAYALEFFAENPDADSVSADPSDGGGWCECQDCVAIGPPSDRALLLANTIAENVTEAVGKDRYVGMYAYGFHSLPPSIEVHPNVIISAATGFIKGGRKVEEIIAGWQAKGATIGIREYYSVNTWDRDLPGASRGSNLDYLATTIPAFHRLGARYLSAESSDNWGCNGLGYYFASRALWDTGQAEKADEIVDDFLGNCFGPAREPMREFYERIDGSNAAARLVFDDLLARMFRLLEQARELAGEDDKIRTRIDELILYTRHAELFDAYRNASGPARQAAYEAMIRHAYRMRGTFLVHSYALYRDVHQRDKAVELPVEADWKVPEADNPWKSSEPFSPREIESILAKGVASHDPVDLDFEPKEFDDLSLQPANTLFELNSVDPGKAATARGKRSWFTVVEEAPTELKLHVTGGLIAHYRDRGNVKIQLWKLGGASRTGERETLIREDASVPPDGKERTVTLPVSEPGVYRIDLEDGRDLTSVTWPEGQRMSWKMALEDHPDSMSGRWNLYFFVPKGTRRIGLYSAAGGGTLRLPDGTDTLELMTESGGFLSTAVPEGTDGKLWKLHHVSGKVCLVNVPPFLARSADELVLPANLEESQK
jgi:hypothetical protein